MLTFIFAKVLFNGLIYTPTYSRLSVTKRQRDYPRGRSFPFHKTSILSAETAKTEDGKNPGRTSASFHSSQTPLCGSAVCKLVWVTCMSCAATTHQVPGSFETYAAHIDHTVLLQPTFHRCTSTGYSTEILLLRTYAP